MISVQLKLLLLLYTPQAAVETRVLVQEVAERHDIIVKLKNEINDLEQQLKRKDTHIQFKDEIIKELRQHRRPNVKVGNFVCCLFLYTFCCDWLF